MDAYTEIEGRYGFALPPIYRTLQALGCFGDAGDLTRWLGFYDCEWLSLPSIAQYSFNPWEIAVDGGFVPLAITGRGEPYCWRLDWASPGEEPPIVLCERSEKATCLAPHLSGLLYRLALEAFAGRNDIGSTPAGKEELARNVETLSTVLPEPWAKRLLGFREMPWFKDKKSGTLLVILWNEAEQIIQADLAFPHLNEVFFHDKGYLQRLASRKQSSPPQ